MSTSIPGIDATMLLEEDTTGTNAVQVAQDKQAAALSNLIAMEQEMEDNRKKAAVQEATMESRNKATTSYWKFCRMIANETQNHGTSISRRYQQYVLPTIAEWDVVNHYYEEDLFEYYCKAVEVEQQCPEFDKAREPYQGRECRESVNTKRDQLDGISLLAREASGDEAQGGSFEDGCHEEVLEGEHCETVGELRKFVRKLVDGGGWGRWKAEYHELLAKR